MVHQVAQGIDLVLRDTRAHVFGLDKGEELFAEFRCDKLFGVGFEVFQVADFIPFLEGRGNGTVLAVAYRHSGIQVQVVDAAVIRGQRGNHVALLAPLAYFFHQLLLECQLFFQFFPLDATLGIGHFLFQLELCCTPYLYKEEQEHAQEHKRDNARKQQATFQNAFRNGTDLLGDDAFADKVGQHPVRRMDGNVVHGFPDAVVLEGNDARLVVREVGTHLFHGEPFFEYGIFHGGKQVVSACKPA